jgi:hypothetical protein
MVDLLLCLGVIFLFVSMLGVIAISAVLVVGTFAGMVLILFWILWVRPVYKIEIIEGKVYGPSPAFRRVSFPLRKIDHRKILHRTRKQKIIGYRDIYSMNGSRIRLCHRFLGKPAVCDIMEIVEKYPFRES